MRRRLVNVLTALSLLLLAVDVAMWVRGYRAMDVLYNETPWRPAPREGCRQVVLSSTIGQLNVIRAGVDGRPLHWCRFGLSGGDGQWHSRTGIASWHVFDRCYVFHPLGFAWAPRGSFIRARRRGGSSSGSSPCRTGR